jgi:hypothetical protein
MTALAVGALIGSLLWTWRPARPARTARTVMIALMGTGCSARHCGDDGIVPDPDRHSVRHFRDLRWPLHRRYVHDSQIPCARGGASSGIHHQRRTPAHHGSGRCRYWRRNGRSAKSHPIDLRRQRPATCRRGRRPGAEARLSTPVLPLRILSSPQANRRKLARTRLRARRT